MEWKPEYGTLTDELMAKVQQINDSRATKVLETKPEIIPNVDEMGHKVGVDTYNHVPPPTPYSQGEAGMSEVGK